MPLFAEQPIPAGAFWTLALEAAFLLGTFYAWIVLCQRYLSGRRVLPAYEPRRLARWSGLDLLLILLFYLFLIFTVQAGAYFVEKTTGCELLQHADAHPAATPKQAVKTFTTEHPLAQALKEKDAIALALAVLVGVIVAPISEELFFRMLLIGWLESAERRWRQRAGLLRRLPRGVLPIVLSSLMFASLHFRPAAPEAEPSNLIFSLCAAGIVGIVSTIFSLGWAHWQSGATAKDLGWAGHRVWQDVATGATAFFAIALPIFALQIDLGEYVVPKAYAPDPIPLFFLAIVLGLLYFRTHRIVPSIVVHMLLNASSLALAWSAPVNSS